MKLGVPNHPKTERLGKVLRLPRFQLVGLVGTTWDYAKRFHKDGDLSRANGANFAAFLGVAPETLHKYLSGMEIAGWLDLHPSGAGFVIHDWFDHCEAYVIRDLIKAGRLPVGWQRFQPIPEGFFTCHDKHNKSLSREGVGVGSGCAVEGGLGETAPKARSVRFSDDDAMAVYAAYPRKAAPDDAAKAIHGAARREFAKGNEAPREYLVGRAAAFAGSLLGQKPPKGAKDFRPYPATFFNQGQYLSDPSEWDRPNGENGAAAKPKPPSADEIIARQNAAKPADDRTPEEIERDRLALQAQVRSRINHPAGAKA